MKAQAASWFVVVAVAALGQATASAQVRLAEYVAPVTAGPQQGSGPAADGLAQAGSTDAASYRLPLDALDPLGIETEVGAARPGGPTAIQPLWPELQQTAPADEVAISPEVILLPGVSAFVYYRHGRRTFNAEHRDRDVRTHDYIAKAAGLEQIWRFGDSKGQLRLGYEFESNHAFDETYRGAAHTLNLGGRIPLFGGVAANFDAGYSWTNYPEYQGLLDVASYRRAFTAGLSGAVGDNFQANLNFSYADEESDEDLLSYRREMWGLNFLYNY